MSGNLIVWSLSSM